MVARAELRVLGLIYIKVINRVVLTRVAFAIT